MRRYGDMWLHAHMGSGTCCMMTQPPAQFVLDYHRIFFNPFFVVSGHQSRSTFGIKTKLRAPTCAFSGVQITGIADPELIR